LNLVRDGAQLWFGLQVVPPGEPSPNEHWEKKVCVLVVSHTGRTTDAEKAVNAVRAALPRPIIDWAQPMPYPMLQSLFDALYPKGLQWYWKGDFVKTLPDEAIEAHLAHAAKLPTVFSAMHLYPDRDRNIKRWPCISSRDRPTAHGRARLGSRGQQWRLER
jgi:hypothetical protein